MSKKIKGEDGKTYVEKKPWYKRWWIWVIVVVVLFFIVGAFAGGGDDDSDSDSGSASTTQSSKKAISLDGQDIEYTKSKKYNVKNSEDTSWSGATAKVNSVTVYKVADGYTYGGKRGKKKVQGLMAVNVTVKAIKDIEILMNIATISIPSINEQHEVETKEDWDDLDKGMSKTGTVYIPLYHLSSVNSIDSLRFKFDCQTQDTDDDDYDHTYDMTINLN